MFHEIIQLISEYPKAYERGFRNGQKSVTEELKKLIKKTEGKK